MFIGKKSRHHVTAVKGASSKSSVCVGKDHPDFMRELSDSSKGIFLNTGEQRVKYFNTYRRHIVTQGLGSQCVKAKGNKVCVFQHTVFYSHLYG